jgi:hypothetical protein
MKQEKRICQLDCFRTVSEEPTKPSKAQTFLNALLSIPVAIGVGLSLITLALVPIVATIVIGGLIAVVSVLGIIVMLVALAIDQSKQKKRVQ